MKPFSPRDFPQGEPCPKLMIEIITIVVEILPPLRYYSDTEVVPKETAL
jgi:hypothetical protein